MRIAYVINSLEGGGASAPIPAVVAQLMRNGCEVRVMALTRRDGRGLAAIAHAGIAVSVREGGEKDHRAALAWLQAEIRRWQPDVIWTSLTRATLLGQIVGRLRGIAVVSWQHNAFLKPVNLALLRLLKHGSALWVADSESVAALTGRRLGVARSRLAVWPLFAADPHAPLAVPWQPGRPLRIGSLGRLHPAKGYDVLIEALARLRANGFAAPARIEIEIAGDGEYFDALVRQAAQAGLKALRFVGFTEPRAFLASLDLYLQPSRREGMCIAAHEAMQAALPVVASTVGELPYTIEEGVSGYTLPPGDPDLLADRLARLLRDPQQLAGMGQAARSRVLDRFGEAAFAEAGADIVQRIRSSRRDRARS